MTRPLRITFIAGEYPPLQGGLGDYTRELGRTLSELGHVVSVITRQTADGRPQAARTASPPSISSPQSSVLSPPSSVEVLRVVDGWGWRAWPAVRRALAGADVVHIQYQTAAYGMHPFINTLPWLMRWIPPPTAHPSPSPSLIRGGGPDASSPPLPYRERGAGGEGLRPLLAITYHDTRIPYLFPKAGRVRDWVTDLPGRGADLVIATNSEDGARLRSIARHLALIPIGSNIAPTAGAAARVAFRSAWGIGLDVPLLVYFGFVNRAKGADTLIEALARLRSSGLPAHLLMLGGQVGASDPTNAQFLAAINAQAQRLGVATAMTWTDFVPETEVSAALMSADMAVLPYRDGVSLQRGTLMAALTHGLPIVTTRPPSPPSAQLWGDTGGQPGPLPALVDDVNASLVPPNDPDALANAVAALWADPARRSRLGEGGRSLSAAFHWDRIAALHIEEYSKLRTQV